MKLLSVLLSCLIVSSCAFPPEPKANSFTLWERFEVHMHLLEGLIDEVKTMLQLYDPISAEDSTPIDVIGYYVKVRNAHIAGFSDILRDIILYLDLPSVAVSFSLKLPEVVGTVEEWESNIPEILGKGSLNFSITNVELFVKAGFNLFGGGFEPTQFKSSIASANVTITGLYNDEEFSQEFSNTINSILNDSINDPQIHKLIGDIIDVIVEGMLG